MMTGIISHVIFAMVKSITKIDYSRCHVQDCGWINTGGLRTTFNKHISRSHPKKTLVCDAAGCHFSTGDQYELNRHKISHGAFAQTSCCCGTCFKTKSNFLRHVRANKVKTICAVFDVCNQNVTVTQEKGDDKHWEVSIEQHLLSEPMDADISSKHSTSPLSKKPNAPIRKGRKRAQTSATSSEKILEFPQHCAPSNIPSKSDSDASSSPSTLPIRLVTRTKRARVSVISSEDSDKKLPSMTSSDEDCVLVTLSIFESQAY